MVLEFKALHYILLGFYCVFLFSLFLSASSDKASLKSLLKYSELVFLVIITAQKTFNKQNLNFLLNVLFCTSAGLTLGPWILDNYFSLVGSGRRLYNVYESLLLLALCLPRLQNQVIYVFPFLMALVTMVLTGSRSGLIGFLLMLSTFYFFISKKMKIIFGILILIVLLVQYKAVLKTIDRFVSKSGSNIERVALIEHSFDMFKQNPFFGIGPGNFNKILLENMDYRFANWKTLSAIQPHNVYLEIMTETGVLGILLFLLFNGLIAWKLIINLIKNSNKQDVILSISLFIWLQINLVFNLFSGAERFFVCMILAYLIADIHKSLYSNKSLKIESKPL